MVLRNSSIWALVGENKPFPQKQQHAKQIDWYLDKNAHSPPCYVQSRWYCTIAGRLKCTPDWQRYTRERWAKPQSAFSEHDTPGTLTLTLRALLRFANLGICDNPAEFTYGPRMRMMWEQLDYAVNLRGKVFKGEAKEKQRDLFQRVASSILTSLT